jgi:hypothetical protein
MSTAHVINFDAAISAATNAFTPHHGGNIRELADRFGLTGMQAHLLIFSRRPDLYDRYLRGLECSQYAQTSAPTFDGSTPDTPVSSHPFHTLHHTAQPYGTPLRWGKRKKMRRAEPVDRLPASTVAAPQTDCSVRINGDMSNLVLHVALASGPVLELTFSSDGHNADKHRSFRD